jgi:mannose-6-phosphate isomerase
MPAPEPDKLVADERPWGHWEVVTKRRDHQVKRILVEPGHRLSYQLHSGRSEHWFIVSGEGVATVDGIDRPIGPGDSIDVPAGIAHRIANSGRLPLVFIEVQTGATFDEEDIVRLADDYGRAG